MHNCSERVANFPQEYLEINNILSQYVYPNVKHYYEVSEIPIKQGGTRYCC